MQTKERENQAADLANMFYFHSVVLFPDSYGVYCNDMKFRVERKTLPGFLTFIPSMGISCFFNNANLLCFFSSNIINQY